MTFKRLKSCVTPAEANMIKGSLNNHGIRSFTTNENFSSLMPHFYGILGAGVQIMVEEDDFQAARKLIPDQEPPDPIVCPNCRSSNLSYGLGSQKKKKIIIILLSLLGGVPFGNIRNNFYCKDCETDFKI